MAIQLQTNESEALFQKNFDLRDGKVEFSKDGVGAISGIFTEYIEFNNKASDLDIKWSFEVTTKQYDELFDFLFVLGKTSEQFIQKTDELGIELNFLTTLH